MNSMKKLELAIERLAPRAGESYDYAELAVSYNPERGLWQAWLQEVTITADGSQLTAHGSVGEGESLEAALDDLARLHEPPKQA